MHLSHNFSRPTAHNGGIVLMLLTVVFVISLTAAAGVGFLLWQDTQGELSTLFTHTSSEETTTAATPMPSTNPADDVLVPNFTVDPTLQDDYNELSRQLLIPLRAYYATKQERLGHINVEPADNTEHTAQVHFELIDSEGTTTYTFFYDRSGTEKTGPYPTWEPSLLDVTE